MAARDREREWGLSEVPAATVGEGGQSPERQRCTLGPLREKRNSPCPEDTPVLRQGPQTGPTLSLSLAAMSSPTSSYLLNNIF